MLILSVREYIVVLVNIILEISVNIKERKEIRHAHLKWEK
jgi:hypothetical protein